MVRQHHQLNEHEFEENPRDSEGQRSLAYHSLWRHKESDRTLQLNNIMLSIAFCFLCFSTEHSDFSLPPSISVYI